MLIDEEALVVRYQRTSAGKSIMLSKHKNNVFYTKKVQLCSRECGRKDGQERSLGGW